jgi:hypothetical protein
MKKDYLHNMVSPLAALQRVLNRFPKPGILIGGIATSILGTPRLTADLDSLILLAIEDVPGLMEFAEQEGIVPRITNALEFARRNRVLLMRHEKSGVNIDISLGLLPFEEEVIERSREVEVQGIILRLPTPEDLVIMKAVAHREKDMYDIRGIIQANPTLDKTRIERWVKQFAEAMDMPELWSDIAGWF